MKNLDMTFTSFRWRFAFVVVDGDDFIAARDPLGVNLILWFGRKEECILHQK
jgi:asparagine synthetase B (glutamine-hydrolysing)